MNIPGLVIYITPFWWEGGGYLDPALEDALDEAREDSDDLAHGREVMVTVGVGGCNAIGFAFAIGASHES